MFLRLLAIETRKLLKNPALGVEVSILAFIFAAYFIIRYVTIADAVRNGLVNTRGLELDLQVGLGLFGNLSVLFYAATAAIISAYDYPDRSIQMWLVRGAPRALQGLPQGPHLEDFRPREALLEMSPLQKPRRPVLISIRIY